jgi:hypothetical protein
MSLSPEIQQQRYSAIELAYSERRWPEVESLSQGLLAELGPNPTDPLQLRLVLLLGHTRLYGMADASGAQHYYSSVLEHCQEQTLRDIAQQGLAQCDRLVQQASVNRPQAAAPWLTSAEPERSPTSPLAKKGVPEGGAREAAANDAAPWLSDLSLPAAPPAETEPETEPTFRPEQAATDPARTAEAGMILVPEIVEEPEQIAVAQADPRQQEEVPIQELSSARQELPSQKQLPSQERPPLPDPGELGAEALNDLSQGLLRIRVG